MDVSRARDRTALRLPVEEFGMLAFDQYQEIYEARYDYAKERVADWQP